MRKLIFLFLIFLVWRILLFAASFEAQKTITLRKIGYEYTRLDFYSKLQPIIANPVIFTAANLDGVAYLGISGHGYTGGNARFFPLFPFLIYLISIPFGIGIPYGAIQFFSGLFFANFCFLLGLYFFYLLVRIDFSEKTALLACAALAVFPTSLFFGMIYSESLFFLLCILSFYFARKNNWFLAGVFGSLLAATRIVGIMIFFALIVELFYKKKELKNKTLKLLSIFIIPFGLLSFVWYNYIKFGNAFYFWISQGNVMNNRSVGSVVFLPQTIFRYIKILLTVSRMQFEWWLALLEFASFFFACIFLYIAWKKGVRLSYLVFSLLCFIIPVFSGTFSGLPRYILIIFPLFIAVSLIKNKLFLWIYFIVSVILLFILTMFFTQSYFIG